MARLRLLSRCRLLRLFFVVAGLPMRDWSLKTINVSQNCTRRKGTTNRMKSPEVSNARLQKRVEEERNRYRPLERPPSFFNKVFEKSRKPRDRSDRQPVGARSLSRSVEYQPFCTWRTA